MKDYKAKYQEMYETLKEKLGREPTLDELHAEWANMCGSEIDAVTDYYEV